MPMIDFVYQGFATATLVTHALIVMLLVVWFLQKKSSRTIPLYQLFASNAYTLGFLSTLSALVGSLFFSEIAKFAPCIMCWYQRILMYPQVLLIYMGILRNEVRFLKPYLLAMNIVGVGFSLYHNALLWFPEFGALAECSTKGGPSCIQGYTFYYGYITIPLMALTVFIFNIVMLWLFTPLHKKSEKKPN